MTAAMPEGAGAKSGSNLPKPAYDDLRDFIERCDRMGELVRIKGADWNLEIGTLAEIIYQTKRDNPPAILFEEIPGYPKGMRLLSGATNSSKRMALTLGFPEPSGPMEVVRAYRDRMKTHAPIPPRMVETGKAFENVDRDGAVDVLMSGFHVSSLSSEDRERVVDDRRGRKVVRDIRRSQRTLEVRRRPLEVTESAPRIRKSVVDGDHARRVPDVTRAAKGGLVVRRGTLVLAEIPADSSEVLQQLHAHQPVAARISFHFREQLNKERPGPLKLADRAQRDRRLMSDRPEKLCIADLRCQPFRDRALAQRLGALSEEVVRLCRHQA